VEPPDAFEKGIRFGCGFVFGGLLALGAGLTWALANSLHLFAAAILIATAFGVGALHYGDAFWERVSRWLWWW
jgi:hypothetical protein